VIGLAATSAELSLLCALRHDAKAIGVSNDSLKARFSSLCPTGVS